MQFFGLSRMVVSAPQSKLSITGGLSMPTLTSSAVIWRGCERRVSTRKSIITNNTGTQLTLIHGQSAYVAHCRDVGVAIDQLRRETIAHRGGRHFEKKQLLLRRQPTSRRDKVILLDVLRHFLEHTPRTLHRTISKSNGDRRELQPTRMSIRVVIVTEELELIKNLSLTRESKRKDKSETIP